MAERLKALVLKTRDPERGPWVRILPFPPISIMDYKYYIPSSTRYVVFENVPIKEDSITLIQIFEADGKQISIMYQNGESPLEVHEIVSYGEIVQFHRHFKKGLVEYDPYAIFPESMRPKDGKPGDLDTTSSSD